MCARANKACPHGAAANLSFRLSFVCFWHHQQLFCESTNALRTSTITTRSSHEKDHARSSREKGISFLWLHSIGNRERKRKLVSTQIHSAAAAPAVVRQSSKTGSLANKNICQALLISQNLKFRSLQEQRIGNC